MKKRSIGTLLGAILVGLLALSINPSGDLRWSLDNMTMRHWSLAKNVIIFKPACAAGFIPGTGGGPCNPVASGTYTLNGPTTGDIGQSLTYTVQPAKSSTATITPSDGGTGGIFTPATVIFNGTAPETYTYTPLQTGTLSISTTNNQSLTNPSPISLAIANDLSGYPSFSGWTTSSASLTTGQSDPFGGTNAVEEIENNTTNYHQLTLTGTVVSGHTYEYGIMVKVGTGTRSLSFTFYETNSASGGIMVIDPATCAATTSSYGGTTIGSPTTLQLSGGWCLAYTTVTPNFTALFMRSVVYNGGEDYAGDGSSGVDIYGAFVQ